MRVLDLRYVRRKLHGDESAGMGVGKGLLRITGEEVLEDCYCDGECHHSNTTTPGL
jgi:hypothetical protein